MYIDNYVDFLSKLLANKKLCSDYKETQSIERKVGSGKKKGFKDKCKAKSIIRSIKANPCQLQRGLVRKFKCSEALIGKVIKSQEYKAYKIKTPKQPIDGEIKGIHSSKKLYKLLSQENLCITEGDETYCKKDFLQ